jgi:uncharacterized protein GlcG (DUF336 family)
MTPRLFIATALLLAPLSARAQLADAKVLTLQAAKTALAVAEAEAIKNKCTVSIAVVDVAGELLSVERFDDASLTTVAVAVGTSGATSAQNAQVSKAGAEAVKR